MLVAIVGTRCAGKSTVKDYFVTSHGFTPVRIITPANNLDPVTQGFIQKSHSASSLLGDPTASNFDSLNINDVDSEHYARHSDPPTQTPPSSDKDVINADGSLCFSSAEDLFQYATKHWRHNFVTVDLRTRYLVELFVRRPFFMLIHVTAPTYERFLRSKRLNHPRSDSLEKFVRDDDCLVFGMESKPSSLQDLSDMVNVHITNPFRSVPDFQRHLDILNLLDPEQLRPGWDAYFMTLASLASQRSNCMKRRVGAVVVRENRVISTGYNGTPRGLSNCNEGGCGHCNGTTSSVGIPYECVCLHAEENALLEAGRERVGEDAVLYCNTCPCLKCTVKIIQTGIKTVVYNLAYKVDDASALLFVQAGVRLRKYSPIQRFHLPVGHSSA